MLLSALAPAAAQGPAEYRITRITGEVTHRPEGGAWTQAEAGVALSPGDRVRTAADGTAEIASEEGDLVELDDGAEFVLSHSRPRDVAFLLEKGRALIKASSGSDRKFRIRMPVGAATVRGTEFAVYQAEDQRWETGVIEGRVAVQTLDESGRPLFEEVVIAENEGARLVPGRRPVRLVGLPPRTARLRPRFAEMRKRTLDVKREWRRDIHKKRRELRRRLRPSRPD